MIRRVTPWLLVLAVLLAAVPCEAFEQRPSAPFRSSDSAQACVSEPENQAPAGTSFPVDCVCLCLSGHSIPAIARNVFTPFENSGKRPLAGRLIPEFEPLGSLFHPPRVV